jgi:hypothetical protein
VGETLVASQSTRRPNTTPPAPTEHIQKVIDAMRGISDELGLSKG